VRIRIRRAIAGVLDGISLSHFVPGLCYEIPDSLGNYLVSIGIGEPVLLSSKAEIIPLDGSVDTPVFSGIAIVRSPDKAADRSPRRKETRRGRKRR
jgi:hypothetical protein